MIEHHTPSEGELSMSDQQGSDLGAFLAGFVIGGLVGAATAIILAPQSGEETRSRLANKSRELRQSGGEQLGHYREVAGNYSKEYRDKAEHVLTDSRERVNQATGRVQEQARIVLDAGKERANQVKEQVSNFVPKRTENAANGDM